MGFNSGFKGLIHSKSCWNRSKNNALFSRSVCVRSGVYGG